MIKKRSVLLLISIGLLVVSQLIACAGTQNTITSTSTQTSTATVTSTTSTVVYVTVTNSAVSTTTSTTTSTTGTSTTATTTTSTITTTTTSGTTTSAIVWSPDMDCSSCHPDAVKAEADPELLAYSHAEAGITCTDCHDVPDLQEIHKDFTSTTTMPEFIYEQSFCLKCHGSYAALIALTADSTAFMTPTGEAINPHDTHLGEADCNKCHRIQEKSPGIMYCYLCHHTGDLECGTCHAVE